MKPQVVNLGVIDIISTIQRRQKLYLALTLQDVERVLGKNSQEFIQIRKSILDNSNEFVRSIVQAIFGDDYEGDLK